MVVSMTMKTQCAGFIRLARRAPNHLVARWWLVPCLMAMAVVAGPAHADCQVTARWDDDPPYFMMSDEGEVTGIDAEMSEEALARVGCTVSWVKMPWARALLELRKGSIDMVTGAYRTPEREQYAWYSDVVGLVSPNILFVRRSSLGDLSAESLTEVLAGEFTLGAQIDVSYSAEFDELARQPVYQDKLQYAPRREVLWRMLARERIDGVIASKLTGLYEIGELGLQDRIVATGLVVSDKPAFFMFSRSTVSEDFVHRFDLALHAMVSDGTLHRIVSRHVGMADLAVIDLNQADAGSDDVRVVKQ